MGPAKPSSITIRFEDPKVKARIAARAKRMGLKPAQWVKTKLLEILSQKTA